MSVGEQTSTSRPVQIGTGLQKSRWSHLSFFPRFPCTPMLTPVTDEVRREKVLCMVVNVKGLSAGASCTPDAERVVGKKKKEVLLVYVAPLWHDSLGRVPRRRFGVLRYHSWSFSQGSFNCSGYGVSFASSPNRYCVTGSRVTCFPRSWTGKQR